LGDKLFLIDYDIPMDRRHSFYYSLRSEIIMFLLEKIEDTVIRYRKFRELKKMSLRQLLSEIEYTKSTQSVIITKNLKLAKIIHSIAIQYGTSNLYEVRKLA